MSDTPHAPHAHQIHVLGKVGSGPRQAVETGEDVALVGAGDGANANRELHHVAFEVSTLAQVLAARDNLRAHNVRIDFEGRRRAGCQIAVEFRDPDNHSLEIYWGVDQIGSDGRVRPAHEWHGVKSLEEAIAHPVPGQDTHILR